MIRRSHLNALLLAEMSGRFARRVFHGLSEREKREKKLPGTVTFF